MLKLLFSALFFLAAGFVLLIVGFIPAVFSGLAWLTGIILFGVLFGLLGLAFWIVRSVFHLIGSLICRY